MTQRKPRITRTFARLTFLEGFYLWMADQYEAAWDCYWRAALMYEHLASHVSGDKQRDLLVNAANCLLKTNRAEDMVRVGNKLRRFQDDFRAFAVVDAIAKRVDALRERSVPKKRIGGKG